MASSTPAAFPAPRRQPVDLLIVAGEHSGDQHAAKLVSRLRALQPDLVVAALGGPELERAGAQLLFDLTASSVVGLYEAVKNLSFFRAIYENTLSWISEYKPKAVCFVDYPGLNLRLAKALYQRKLSRPAGGPIRTLYYISPQIWAWKSGRRFSMAKHLDSLAVIFPFETQSYADTGLATEFVGHPFVDADHVAPVTYDANGPILLLPGSRKQAVARIFPVMLAGFEALHERSAQVMYPSREIEQVLRGLRPPENVKLIPTPTGDEQVEPVRASAVLTSSGTMSMHCALAGIPGAIVYRAHPLTYLIGKRLVKVPYLGIANLLLREAMYPEYLQNAAEPEMLAAELRQCLHDGARRRETERKAQKLREILHQPTQGDAANWVLRWLQQAG